MGDRNAPVSWQATHVNTADFAGHRDGVSGSPRMLIADLASILRVTRTITLRLSDEAYEAVKRYAEAADTSMNAWVERVLDAEDMRRRCAAHAAWMRANPAITQVALAFGEANQRALAAAGLPNLAGAAE